MKIIFIHSILADNIYISDLFPVVRVNAKPLLLPYGG